MEHDRGRSRRTWWLALVVVVLGITSCGETGGKRQPDAGTDATSGSGTPCTFDTSKLDHCTL